MLIRIAVCDNDMALCRDIARLIAEQRPDAEVRLFTTAEEMLNAAEDFGIYFLDIKGISGLDAARELRLRQTNAEGRRCVIVFITGYREYMEEAFDVHAFHYLLKPVDRKKFAEVLEHACTELSSMEEQQERYVFIKTATGQQKILLRDIIYIESNNKKVTVHARHGIYEVQGKMDDFELALGASFYRCHRCYLVNFAKISAYRQGEIEVTNGDKLLLAQRKYSDFVKTYLRYAKRGGIVNV